MTEKFFKVAIESWPECYIYRSICFEVCHSGLVIFFTYGSTILCVCV